MEHVSTVFSVSAASCSLNHLVKAVTFQVSVFVGTQVLDAFIPFNKNFQSFSHYFPLPVFSFFPLTALFLISCCTVSPLLISSPRPSSSSCSVSLGPFLFFLCLVYRDHIGQCMQPPLLVSPRCV